MNHDKKQINEIKNHNGKIIVTLLSIFFILSILPLFGLASDNTQICGAAEIGITQKSSTNDINTLLGIKDEIPKVSSNILKMTPLKIEELAQLENDTDFQANIAYARTQGYIYPKEVENISYSDGSSSINFLLYDSENNFIMVLKSFNSRRPGTYMMKLEDDGIVYFNRDGGIKVNDNGTTSSYNTHHSCSFGDCELACVAKKFKNPSLEYIGEKAISLLASCSRMGKNTPKWLDSRESIRQVFNNVRAFRCGYECGINDPSTSSSKCPRCIIGSLATLLGPAGSCTVGLWNILGDQLDPYAECASECGADPSAYGNICKNDQVKMVCWKGGGLYGTVEGYEGQRCNDCEWRLDTAVKDYTVCQQGEECVEGSGGPECKKKPICRSNDRCVVASPSPSGGCMYTRTPGCDQPDDNVDLSTKNVQSSNMRSASNYQSNGIIRDQISFTDVYDPKIAVLNNGFADSIVSHLSNNGEQVGMINVNLEGLDKYTILVIPSGGLHGIGTQTFMSDIDNFVKNGGVLVVFSQQYGSDYSSIPGNLDGFGWQQDQSCQSGSAAMTSFHPILSGQSSSISNFNIDGFFTKWPQNSKIVLTRVKNGFPALITYPYGTGMVMASTLYSDYSNTLHQQTNDEQILLRDMTAWLKGEKQIQSFLQKDAQVETLAATGLSNFSVVIKNIEAETSVIPEFNPGETVALDVNVINAGNKTSDRVVFKVYNPSFLPTFVNVSTTILENESKNISLLFDTISSSQTGIWFALYTLYSGDEAVGAGDAGSFALGVKIDDLSIYNISLTLRAPDNTIAATKNISTLIRPGDNETAGISFNPSNRYGIWYLEYQAQNNIGQVTSKGVKMFSLSRFATASSGWKYPGNFSFTITSDSEDFMMNQAANFTFNIWNFGDVDKTVKVTWGSIHHVWAGVVTGGWDYGEEKSISVPANSQSSFSYTLPRVVSSDRLRAVFYIDGKVAGYADRGINAVNPQMVANLDTNINEYYSNDKVSIRLDATNIGSISYDQPINLSIVDQENQVVFSNSTIVSFSPNSAESISYEYPIPENAKPGIYRISARWKESYGRLIFKNFVVLPIKLQLTNKTLPDHIIPDSVQAAAFVIQNTGSTGNVTFNLSLKDNLYTNYTNSSTFSLARGNNITLNFAIPVNASDYIDGNKYILYYTDGTMNGRKEYSSKIEVVYDMLPSYRQGETLAFNATVLNIGEIAEIITANFSVPDLSFQNNSDLTIYPGNKFTRSFNIPISDGTVSGAHDILTKIGQEEYRMQFYIPPASVQLNLSDTEYSGNEDIMVGIENSGGNGTLYDLNIQLKDTKGNIVGDISETNLWLGAGEFTNRTLTIPDQAASGKYDLIAWADYDSKYSDLFKILNITGLEAGIRVETDQKIYLETDEKIVLSSITNGNKAIENGNLHLQIRGQSGIEATPIMDCTQIEQPGEYALSDNISSTQSPCIQIWSDDVILDGRGFTIDGLNKYNSGTGVEISRETHPSNVIIKNMKIKNWGYGIEINGDYEIIKNNELTYNNYAIIPYRGNYNIIEGNILDKNEYGIHPQGYLSQVGNTYRGNIITNTINPGIYFDECDCEREFSDTTIEDNVILNSESGIDLYSYGQKIYNFMIRNNTIRSASSSGIHLDGSNIQDTTVTGNTITDCGTGIEVYDVRNSTIYNNYLNNTLNAYDSGHWNVWNTEYAEGTNIVGGPYLGGNFWANPEGNGFSQNVTTCEDIVPKDGICDSTYMFAQESVDELPLAPAHGEIASMSNILSKKDSTVTIDSSKILAMNVLETPADTILWEDDISVTNDSNSFYQLEPINAGILGNAVGKFILQGTLTSSTGQKIAENEYNFYVIPGNTSLETELNKKLYRPDEIVTLKIRASNFADVALEDVTINIDVDGEVYNESELLTIPTGDNFEFQLDLPVSEGTHSIRSQVTQTGTVLVEILDDYTVMVPSVAAGIAIPEVVGITPFFIDVMLTNTGEVNASVNVNTSADTKTAFMMPGEIELLRFENQINANKTIYVNISGDLVDSIPNNVEFGDSVAITMNTSKIYLPGKVIVPYLVENNGLLDVHFNLTFNLGSINETQKIFLLPGQNLTGILQYDLTAGDYTLGYSSIYGSNNSNFTVAPRGADIQNLIINKVEGAIIVNATIKNLGTGFFGNIRLSSEIYINESTLEIEAAEETNVSYVIDTSEVSEGNYTITLEVLEDGHEISNKSGEVYLAPNLEFTPIQDPLKVEPGENNIVVTVKNLGTASGFAEVNMTLQGIGTLSNSSWIFAGDKKELSFDVLIPDDLEEKNYKMLYEFNGIRSDSKFFVDGIKISVNASLDKYFYTEGENAKLSLTVNNLKDMDLIDISAKILFSGVEQNITFDLTGLNSKTLSFNVPVNFTTGEKRMLYSIYTESGRSIYINSININQRPPEDNGIVVYTEKQVYSIYDTVKIFIDASLGGNLMIKGPGINELISISPGEITKTFPLPALLSDTYYLEYTFNGNSSSYPFDVDGYSAKIIESRLDRKQYSSGDLIKFNLTVEANRDFTGIVNISIFDPDEVQIGQDEFLEEFIEGENKIEGKNLTLKASRDGLYIIVPKVLIDLPEQPLSSSLKVSKANSLVTLVSSAAYFDVKVPQVPPFLNFIEVSPLTKTLIVGDNFTFTASPKDQYGATFTATVTWSSSNLTVGTVDATGKFIASNPGTAKVNATNGSFTGTGLVTVEKVPTLTDTTPPTTTATLSGTLGNNGWYTSDVHVNLTATDNAGGSGIKKTEYSFDNATWIEYNAEFPITTEGTTTLYYRSIDNAGNIEPTKNQAIKIDKTSPLIESITLYPANTTAGATINISVRASDNIGVVELTAGNALTNSNGLWQGSITASSSIGSYTVTIRANDSAGNSAEKTVSYSVVNPVGGIAVTSIPKPLVINLSISSSALLNIKLSSTANIDDTVELTINTNGISSTSAINLAWFNRTFVRVQVPAGKTVYVPFMVSVPAGTPSGYKTFKNNASSFVFGATSVDTGVVNVKP